MICNKCGKPIIPGEDSCRECGNVNDFPVNKYNNVEIIDFIEPEIIDFTTGEDEVSIFPSNNNDEVKDNADVNPEVTPITEAPLEATGALKKVELPKDDVVIETPAMPENPLENETRSALNDATPYVVTSPETAKEENEEQVETNDPVKEVVSKEKEVKDNDGSKSRLLGVVMLLILLLFSVLLNVYLLITEPQCDKEDVNPAISDTMQTVYFGDYRVEVPSNWITITDKDSSNMLFMDSSEEWTVSINIKDGIDAKALISNKDKITESFGKSKYLFTSDYVADATDESFHVFKGKYYNYITYVVTRTINSSVLAMADLKYKGEVDEEIYNKVVNVLKTIAKLDSDSLYSNNFEFNDISGIFAENLKSVSSGD